jgi:hypothetical protein
MPILTYQGRRIRLTQRMVEILYYATRYPKPSSCHNIGHDDASKKAVERLRVGAWSRSMNIRISIV